MIENDGYIYNSEERKSIKRHSPSWKKKGSHYINEQKQRYITVKYFTYGKRKTTKK